MVGNTKIHLFWERSKYRFNQHHAPSMKTKSLYFGLFVLIALLLMPTESVAQDLHPSRRASPLGMAQAFVGDAVYVKATYGRPYKRDRDNIIGADDAMHAYGDVWRFGANEPTEISFSGAVMVGGERVEAGTYSIFATPGADSWTIHFNDLRGGSPGDYDAANNLVDVEVTPGTPEEEVEQFTITFEEVDDGLHMVTTWLDWELRVPITAAM